MKLSLQSNRLVAIGPGLLPLTQLEEVTQTSYPYLFDIIISQATFTFIPIAIQLYVSDNGIEAIVEGEISHLAKLKVFCRTPIFYSFKLNFLGSDCVKRL